MEQQGKGIVYRKLRGISTQGMRIWGLVFLLLGAVGYGVMGPMLAGYSVDEQGITEASLSLVTAGSALQALYYCAIPIFSFLLVQGMVHTISVKDYAIRVGILALITELPYNLCMTGKVLGALSFAGGFHFDFSSFSLNPVFGTLLCLLLLYFYTFIDERMGKNIIVKLLIWLVAFLWVAMLHIDEANRMLLIVPVLWACRKKKGLQVFFGCVVTFLCCIFDMGTLATVGCMIAPLTFMLVHFYNGEPDQGNKYVNYLAFPVILLVAGLAAKLAL